MFVKTFILALKHLFFCLKFKLNHLFFALKRLFLIKILVFFVLKRSFLPYNGISEDQQNDYFCKNNFVKFEFLTDENCCEIQIYGNYAVKMSSKYL